jgi:hypothetical protein
MPDSKVCIGPKHHATSGLLHIYRLKCNRGLPCDACTRRDKSALCSYAPNANRNRHEPSKRRDIKDRLSTLENLVSSFLSDDTVVQPRFHAESMIATEEGGYTATTAEQYNRSIKQSSILSSSSGGEDALTPETPHMQETGNGQVNYIDPSHWQSILDDIKEVREHLSIPNQSLSRNETDFDADRMVKDASFLFGPAQNPTIDEILRSLPSQPICDMLVSWYFNSRFMVLGKIEENIQRLLKGHGLTFILRHYTSCKIPK